MKRGIAATLAALALLPAIAVGQTRALIVTGLGGEATYSTQFAALGDTLALALRTRYGLADSAVVWLGEDSVARNPRYSGQATRIAIEGALARFSQRMQPGDQLLVVLIGHGGGEGAGSRLNIPGPDLTAADFARLLRPFERQRVAFLNLASASGDMVPTLSAPGRIVLTATRTAFERNESQFGRYFVAAVAGDGADVDKDGRVSLLEAYRFADAETRRHYENASKLRSEHAQLDDDGDGKATAAPDGRAGDGVAARRFFLDADRIASRVASSDPRLAQLYRDRFVAEDQIETLKARKAGMEIEAYEAELERLLLALARTSREIRQLEGRNSRP